MTFLGKILRGARKREQTVLYNNRLFTSVSPCDTLLKMTKNWNETEIFKYPNGSYIPESKITKLRTEQFWLGSIKIFVFEEPNQTRKVHQTRTTLGKYLNGSKSKRDEAQTVQIKEAQKQKDRNKAKQLGRKPITLKTLAGEAPLNPRESASLPSSSGTRNNDTIAQRFTVDGGVGSGTKPFNQTFKLTRIQQTHTKIQNQTDLRSYQRILDAYNRFIISDIHVCGNRFRTRGRVSDEAQIRRSKWGKTRGESRH
ncbi:hypothetical protein YC2023_040652 [Brassica napus]